MLPDAIAQKWKRAAPHSRQGADVRAVSSLTDWLGPILQVLPGKEAVLRKIGDPVLLVRDEWKAVCASILPAEVVSPGADIERSRSHFACYRIWKIEKTKHIRNRDRVVVLALVHNGARSDEQVQVAAIPLANHR